MIIILSITHSPPNKTYPKHHSSFLINRDKIPLCIYTFRSMLSRCGGSLISRKFVVTAGHCVARATPRQVHVTLGDYVINSAVEPLPAYTFGVRTISVHPYFKFTPQADRFDVAVLQLERPVHYMPHIGKLSTTSLILKLQLIA